MIKKIEQISFNAWPGLRTIFYDNWILRISEGVTRRANSISPIFGSSIDSNTKIKYCEKLYQRNNLPVIYKMTSQAYPNNLDSILKNYGYIYDAETSVQILQLDEVILNGNSDKIQIKESLEQDWLYRFLDFNGYDVNKKTGFENILNQIILKTGFLDLVINEKFVGCGLGVIEGDFIGLFDIVVAPDFRGKGFGKNIVESLIYWGKNNGCKTAYLQVMTNNSTAQNLYDKIGFKEIYKYWYRIKD
jgi:ribosomal protein S18 acetylase RimI-like enzyme